MALTLVSTCWMLIFKNPFPATATTFTTGAPPPAQAAPQPPAPVAPEPAAPAPVAPGVPSNIPHRGNPGWTLHRRPGHWHGGGPSANPAEAPIESTGTSTAGPSTTGKAGRRGSKTFAKAPGSGATNGARDELNESDNYPPDFKARLAQLVSGG